MAQFTRNGVPDALQRDAWWFAPEGGRKGASTAGRGHRVAIFWPLIAILLLADFVFWQGAGAIPTALFSYAFAGILSLSHRPDVRQHRTIIAVLVLSTLPLLAFYQALSVLFWLAGLIMLVCLTTGWRPEKLAQFALRLPWAGIARLARQTQWDGAQAKSTTEQFMKNWSLAAIVGIAFAGMFVIANPFAETWIWAGLGAFDLSDDFIIRLLFWVFITVLGLMALSAKLIPEPNRKLSAAKGVWFSPMAVRNALIVFNLMFAIQLVTDSAVIIMGMDLPNGMTLAEFAHRGAYPMVVTAVMAGAFMLIARPHRSFPTIKVLLGVWVAQNLILVGSAAYRLSVYVDAFGWTYLRLHSFIWMALVAAGLALVAYDLHRRQKDGWVFRTSAVMGFCTLYLACFVNFGHFIATANIARYHDGQHMGWWYLCNMDVSAKLAIADYYDGKCHYVYYHQALEKGPETWRDWDFRRWNIDRRLHGETPGETE